ncbi:MAG: hypothetical protein ABSD59_06285 [Terracidiphilus sp.]
MQWSVDILNDTVAAETRSLPADMHARFLRIALQIEQAGLAWPARVGVAGVYKEDAENTEV